MRALLRLLLLATLVSGFLQGVSADDAKPLTLTDIVRAWTSGTSEAELIRRIRKGPVDLEFDDELLTEVGIAGVPAGVVQALREARDGSAPPVMGPDMLRIPVTIVVETPRGRDTRIPKGLSRAEREGYVPEGPSVLDIRALIPEDMINLVRLPPGVEMAEDIALFVADTTAVRVRDGWRASSPMGSDDRLLRHRMLAFVDGAKVVDPRSKEEREAYERKHVGRLPTKNRLQNALRKRPKVRLQLTLPEVLELPALPEGDPTNLVLGLAYRLSGTWVAAQFAVLETTQIAPELSVEVTVTEPRKGAAPTLKVRTCPCDPADGA